MRHIASKHCLLIISFALLVCNYACLNLAVSQVMAPESCKICSCADLKYRRPDLKNLSRDEFRKYVYKMAESKYKSNKVEAYEVGKYYGCRFPNDSDDFAIHLKKYVKAYEEALSEDDRKKDH